MFLILILVSSAAIANDTGGSWHGAILPVYWDG